MEEGNEKIPVGKYSGITIREICNRDPAYIGWILNNREIQGVEDEGGLCRVKFILKHRIKTMFD
jgi:hypothetical protein